MRFVSTFLSALLLFGSVSYSGELSGWVTGSDGDGLPSVSVITNLASVGTTTDPDGYFELNITEAAQSEVRRVTFSSVGYQSRQFTIDGVPDVVVLQEQYYRGTDILVRGDRAQRGQSPVAFSNFSADNIERDYMVGELPLMLETTPNYFSYSDGGSSLGYSYVSIRGFDDKRITTYINGVPLNDPEWQTTYFVDLPDFAANVDDIQIQRGIGNSLYGDASFGGTINIVTNSMARPRGATFTAGYGEYTSGGKSVADIYRQSVTYSSGLLNGTWHLTGRLSNQRTDGYREHSWYNGKAYYLSLARLDPNMTTELYIYGGPIKMHLAFWGATREAINQNRRFNPRTYPNETDNFNQPHFHLHNRAQLSETVLLSNTLYFIRGKGHYEQLAEASVYDDYGIDPLILATDSLGAPVVSGEIIRQDRVTKNQFGWNPRLDIDHERGRHTLGGSVYYFVSDHTGRVTSAEHVVGALDPEFEFYRWDGTQWVGSAFVEERYQLSDRLSVQATAQLRYQRFDLDEEAVGAFSGINFSRDWLFASPRLGLTYKLNTGVSLFTNFALSSRPPIVATIYDGTNPYQVPLAIKDERVLDIELGGEYKSEHLASQVNLFWMDFRDEILSYGPVNEFTGLRQAVNADRTVHAGIELSAAYKMSKSLTLDGNLAYNYNRVKEFAPSIEVYDPTFTTFSDTVEVDYSNKKIAGFPDVIGNFVTDWHDGKWRVTHRARFVGRRYMELANIEHLSLDPYLVGSLSVSYAVGDFLNVGKLTLSARVDNWGDKKYETYGYGGNYAYDDGFGNAVVDGWAEYYVAAERSFYGQLQLEMF